MNVNIKLLKTQRKPTTAIQISNIMDSSSVKLSTHCTFLQIIDGA
jgi:hypothetical protein